ncbi:MAG: DUF4274 domain-containing protein [Planctomycetales bacterium]|nr:DUF4274 domain-containing protein [Planctomycetales bacterium]
MSLTKRQSNRLRFLILGAWAENWLNGKESRSAALKTFRATISGAESSEELHQFVYYYNWDDGVKQLQWVLNHPLCDQGTALLAFWLGEPAFYFQYRNRMEVPEWGRPNWTFLQKTSNRYLNGGFERCTIKTIPTDILGHDYLRPPKTDEGKGLYRIPYGMCVASPGRVVKRMTT